MRSASQRFVLLALLLIGLWVVVYWAWPVDRPEDSAGIVFDGQVSPELMATIESEQSPTERPTVPGEDLSPAVDPLLADAGGPSESPDEAERSPQGEADEDPADADESVGLEYPDGVIPPEFRDYTIRSGDNIYAIAQRQYGEPRYWQAIAKANPRKDPSRMIVGSTWRLPVDPENIQGIPVDPETGEPLDNDEPVVAEPDAVEYTVVSGDTLSAISRMFYGTTTKWRRIRDANAGKVNREGTNIRPGMTLVIPAPEDD